MAVRIAICFTVVWISALPVFGDDSAYHSVRDNIFWPRLYNRDYVGLYCGRHFTIGHKITAEHVYPADWIALRLTQPDV